MDATTGPAGNIIAEECALTARHALTEPAVAGAGGLIALTADDLRAHAVWLGLGCGGSAAAQALVGASLAADVGENLRPSLTPAPDAACEQLESPVLVQLGLGAETRSDAFFLASANGSTEVRRQPLWPEPSGARTLTNDATPKWLLTASSRQSENALLTWVEGENRERLVVRPVFVGAETLTVWEADEGERVAALAAGQLPDEDGAGLSFIVWSVTLHDSSSLWLQELDAVGRAEGSPKALAEGLPVVQSLAMASSEAGAALVWQSRSDELRLLLLDPSGEAIGRSRRVTRRGEQAFGAGITARGTGYVLAYRNRRPDDEVTLRLATLDGEGEILRTDDVATTSSLRKAVQVAATAEGRIALAWADAEGTLGEVHVAWVGCDG